MPISPGKSMTTWWPRRAVRPRTVRTAPTAKLSGRQCGRAHRPRRDLLGLQRPRTAGPTDSTICAERNAIFQAAAKSEAPVVIRAVVVFTPTDQPTAPCGACRQVLNEFGPDAGSLLSVCNGPAVIEKRLSELLPEAFGPENLA